MTGCSPSHAAVSHWWQCSRSPRNTLKAIVHSQYGSPDLLQFKEADKSAPRDNEVLIAVHATTVSTADCNMRNFTFVTRSMLPFAKLTFGSGKPWRARVLATEVAGEVESAGTDVTKFKKEDRIVASTGMSAGGYVRPGALTHPSSDPRG